MNADAYYDWVNENDTYPEHSHKWIVGLYNKYEGVEGLHRYFGVFETKLQAKEFAAEYREKHTKPGFISSIRLFPLCEAL
jgi:hypothetical protein